MFATGDYVVYGNTGICQVMGVTTMEMEGVSKDKLYYVLRPEGRTKGTIFTPVENNRVVIRRILTKEEAKELIEEIPEIEMLGITNEKQREETYKECMQSCQCREWVRVIKTIYCRKQDRLAKGKKATATDERYLKAAEDNLYAELSMLLGVPRSEMVKYIADRITMHETVQAI